jgi:hypothetical protein
MKPKQQERLAIQNTVCKYKGALEVKYIDERGQDRKRPDWYKMEINSTPAKSKSRPNPLQSKSSTTEV